MKVTELTEKQKKLWDLEMQFTEEDPMLAVHVFVEDWDKLTDKEYNEYVAVLEQLVAGKDFDEVPNFYKFADFNPGDIYD